METSSNFLLVIILIIFSYGSSDSQRKRPLVIAHRGASGERPEHTAIAYELAIEQGADFIECDICLTKDLIPFCSHDCSLNASTDISVRNNLKDRVSFHDMDLGEPEFTNSSDYYSIDFTWDELDDVLVKQNRLDRDQSFNFQNTLCSFEKFLDIAKKSKVGVYPELKYPVWQKDKLSQVFKEKNTTYEKLIIDLLVKKGFDAKSKKVYLQTFDKETAKILDKQTDIPVIFLAWRNFNLSTVEDCAKFVQGVGLWKNLIFEWGGFKNGTANSTGIVKRAHELNLKVHVYTFRIETKHVPFIFGNDVRREYDAFLKENIDGYFTDYPLSLASHLDYRFQAQCPNSMSNGGYKLSSINNISLPLALVLLVINKIC